MKSTVDSGRLQLVGGQQVLAADCRMEAVLQFYGDLFDRLTKQVRHIGKLARYVGYQSSLGAKDYLHFFGIEVDKIEAIPAGMLAWDLQGDQWTVWEVRDGHDAISRQERIDWEWLAPGPTGKGRWTGEFTAPCPKELDDDSITQCCQYWLSANAYTAPQKATASKDDVQLADYDASWPQQFDQFARWLRDYLGSGTALRVEHCGSTAIPGMIAKPIIDVLVEIPSFAAAKRRAVPLLNMEEWEYWWYSQHMVFIKREQLQGQRTHHVHLAPRGHEIWQGLAFRDYLRAHPLEAARYATLKRKLAASYGDDRERYTQAKTAFVREVTARALQGC